MPNAPRQLILENVSSSLRNASGCLRFDVLEEAGEPCRFTLYGVYRDAADLDAHLRSCHFESFSEAMRDIFVSQSIRQFDLRNQEAAPRATASPNTQVQA
jgi:(4S)-4-hydroxy-5-phosphonooxypentane-2,3-dione isomerase